VPAELIFIDDSLLRWIAFAPLASAVASGIALAWVRRPVAPLLVVWGSCLSVLCAFGLSVLGFAKLVGLVGDERGSDAPLVLVDTLYTWVGVGVGSSAFSADLEFRFDALSAVMCLVVTGVGFLIHVYSVGYMRSDARDDGGLQRFFCYLNLFCAAMLVLVLADNLLLMFVGWEGVGLCSYLLIGFWYGERENAYAGSKAFIVNRIGDFGLLLGILLLFWSMAEAGRPAVSFRAIEAGLGLISAQSVQLPGWLGGGEMALTTLIALCFFLGAVGKSAQIPLYVWLPDAMAGPTPVSALIHAATMVTAGVYLVARLSFLYEAAPGALVVIAWTGGLTAIFAALIATAQDDIKKVLAYSTISQVGFMFMALGSGAYAIAIFHLVTHAFFKALLFMGAGAVIVATQHEQDMQRMGGLRKQLKLTWWLMLVGVLAICGFPGFSGFFSKDEILTSLFFANDLPGRVALYWMGVATSGLTAFYMFRLFFLTFHGKMRLPRGQRGALDDPDDSMLWPLHILAVLALLGGLVGMPQFWGDLMEIDRSNSLGHFLSSVVVVREAHEPDTALVMQLLGAVLAASVAGFGLAYLLYISRPQLVSRIERFFALPQRVVARRFYVDEMIDLLLVRPLLVFSDRVLFRGVDVGLIDRRIVEGSALAIRALVGSGLKYLHSGLAQSYLLLILAGTVALLVYLVTG
jgi:NADH-quinone oxidoreductase subunit L